MIAIIDYNAGNVRSVQNALTRLGYPSAITKNETEIRAAEKVILPGVGEAGSAMRNLRNSGLDEVIPTLTQPFLGICLGLQVLCEYSEEGDTPCLGIFSNQVRKFEANEIVPHMGWNEVRAKEDELFRGLNSPSDFYFVHSYYAELSADTSATCNYILPFSAALNKGNFYATQFHPEKSSTQGTQLLLNFLRL
ncbi:imidazole glycerol phosphate synthase subunit HisH [Phaeocystidibacter luteus]|uniref:Imidazole glycerol phosphate synthase subunit HisH n=1 Tax=Phaeocystidibacter luteus TaxID=911197 RepID=A0A6N6RE17_9FLAO|nr:imidazole glycerol phosphate synthase subunit HisH [Phaeocystidibacter luteus]KAB2807731.1 imidazole glycerol phosphate synthase subunit HisH [Phaeocystidibacter luteus]